MKPIFFWFILQIIHPIFNLSLIFLRSSLILSKEFIHLILNSPNSLLSLYNNPPSAENKVKLTVRSVADCPNILVRIRYTDNRNKMMITTSIQLNFVFTMVKENLLLWIPKLTILSKLLTLLTKNNETNLFYIPFFKKTT